MRILIIEDEDLAADRLKKLLLEIEPTAEISGPVDTVSGAIEHLKLKTDYDLIFLDIQLADGRSFHIFNETDPGVPVIFTTAFDEYALQAFELNSIDYLLKPVNRAKLKAALEKYSRVRSLYNGTNPNQQLMEILRNINKKADPQYRQKFLINQGDSMIPVKSIEIACFYAEEKVVFMLTKENKRHLIPNTLDELETSLDPKQFFRVNRQFIISGDCIKKIHTYFNYKLKVNMLPNPGIEIIVSRSRSAQFKNWMNGL